MGTTTLKVKGFRSGMTPSDTFTGIFTITQLPSPTPSIAPVAGIYGVGQLVTLIGSSGSLRFTSDGTDPTSTSPIYTTPLVLQTSPTTIKVRNYVPGLVPSPIVAATYTLRVPSPTISPAGGTYASMPSVSLSTTLSGAAVRYTLDARTPTTSSTLYVGALAPFAPDTTVIAIATKAGWADSNLSKATYFLAETGPVNVASPAVTSIGGVNLLGISSLAAPLSFSVTNATPADVFARVNGKGVSLSQPNSTTFVASNALTDGLNLVEFNMTDTAGLAVSDTYFVWAGSRSLSVTVRDWLNRPLPGATVIVGPQADWSVWTSATTNSSGVAVVSSLPNSQAAPIFAEISAPDFLPQTVDIAQGVTSLAYTLYPSNGDFSLGLAGWTNVSPSPAADVFVHQEQFPGFSVCFDPACDRSSTGQGGALQTLEASSPIQSVYATTPPGAVTASSGLTSGADYDLSLGTPIGNTGLIRATRVYRLDAGTTSLSIRYRFASSEMACGVTLNCVRQEDYFRIAVNGTDVVAKTVSQLNGQYNSVFAIPWQILTVPVTALSTVQVDFYLANVGDGKFPSALDIDYIQENKYKATVALTEPWQFRLSPGVFQVKLGTPLQFLSVGPHPYGSPLHAGYTNISGTLTLDGPANDSIVTMSLEVTGRSLSFTATPLATGVLTAAATSAIIGKPLHVGANPGVTFTGDLFEINSNSASNFGNLNPLSLEWIDFRVLATTQSGKQSLWTPSGNLVRPLYRYAGPPGSRTSPASRDTGVCIGTTTVCNGDDWTRLSAVSVFDSVFYGQGVRFNDTSNMNGGVFPSIEVTRPGSRWTRLSTATRPGIRQWWTSYEVSTMQPIANLVGG